MFHSVPPPSWLRSRSMGKIKVLPDGEDITLGMLLSILDEEEKKKTKMHLMPNKLTTPSPDPVPLKPQVPKD